ncbi:hypothetical protein AKJ64_03925 [candidate division MSBL1 archaeon SCGC-AAA259E17]|uniref:Uncharacterized protein n=1 Tax=candidate division MSBL1 archaeon SCGC-AAA259E17 TaxID=1698263 RepID=A0A133UD86_9EURY|nr:hypothetical protein AKJ64_03925 [candidate division MSBL1 archaeon SCGC-AAA259E17]
MYGKSRTAAKTCSGAMRTFTGFFDPAPNSVYGSFDLAQSIMKMGMEGTSAESRSKPSPDVVLRRVYGVDEKGACKELEDFNERIFWELFSSKELAIAVDFTAISYYGEENPILVSDPPIAIRTSTAFSRLFLVKISEGLVSSETRSIIHFPAS